MVKIEIINREFLFFTYRVLQIIKQTPACPKTLMIFLITLKHRVWQCCQTICDSTRLYMKVKNRWLKSRFTLKICLILISQAFSQLKLRTSLLTIQLLTLSLIPIVCKDGALISKHQTILSTTIILQTTRSRESDYSYL